MPITIKGKVYFLVDVITDGFFVYEIYEDENGKRYRKRIDYVRWHLWLALH